MHNIHEVFPQGRINGATILEPTEDGFGHLKTTLEARLVELLSRVGVIDDVLREPGDLDLEEQAREASVDEVLEGLSAVHSIEIRQILAALQRMQNGTYGVCVMCDEPISIARLAAVPQAATCLKCATAK